MSAHHPPPLNLLSAAAWLAALPFLLGFGGYLVTRLPLPLPPLGAELGLMTTRDLATPRRVVAP